MRPVRAIALALFCATAASGTVAQAQPYPNRPIRMVIAFPPGGTSDYVGRVVGTKFAEYLGQPIVIDNRAGASSLIGTQAVASAAPDGYTLLMASSDLTILPGAHTTPPYDASRDFAPVGMVLDYPQVLVANPNLPAKDAKELIALAKARPGKLNFASGGTGSSNHLSGEWFRRSAGIELTHVPYKGNGPAITDLLADRVQLLFTSVGSVEGFLKSGKLKAITVTGRTRVPSLPDVQTVAENALPGYEFKLWYGLVAPAGTPAPVIERLNADLRKTIASPEVAEKLVSIGGTPNVGTPQEFGTLIREELVRWTKLAREVGIKAE